MNKPDLEVRALVAKRNSCFRLLRTAAFAVATVMVPLGSGFAEARTPQLNESPAVDTPGMRLESLSDATGQEYLRRVTAAAKAADGAPALVATAEQTPDPRLSAPSAPALTPAAFAVAALAPVAERSDTTLVIGVLPNVSASILNSQYEHLKRYLEKVSGNKVRIVVPPDFKAMFDNTMNGEYDLSITAPHFARVAQADRNMVPLGMYEPRLNALLVAPVDTSVTSPRDVRDKVVAFVAPNSLVSILGQQWLRSQSMEAGKDYEVRGARSDMGVGGMLLKGEAVAAVMSNGEFSSLPRNEQARLKILETFTTLPNFVVVAHPRLGSDRHAALRGHLRDFFVDKEDGAAFLRATNLVGMGDAGEAQLRELDSHTAATRQLMGMTN